jgi:hypothetical protein
MTMKTFYKYVSDKFGNEEMIFHSVEDFEAEAKGMQYPTKLRRLVNKDLSIDWVDEAGDVILEERYLSPGGRLFCLFGDEEGKEIVSSSPSKAVIYHILGHSFGKRMYTGVWDARVGMYVREDEF